MIGVSSSNKSFRVLARYLVEGRTEEAEKRVAWIASRNLPTDDPELAAKIMRATAAQNVRVKEPVYHVALSFDPGDTVDRAAMERVADHVLETLELQEHQVLIVAHGGPLSVIALELLGLPDKAFSRHIPPAGSIQIVRGRTVKTIHPPC